MIRFCETILAEIGDDGIVIPGHGPVTDSAALKAYIHMLRTVRDRVSAMMAEGKSLLEIVTSRPTAEFDETYGPEMNSLGLVDRVYTSLKRDSQ